MIKIINTKIKVLYSLRFDPGFCVVSMQMSDVVKPMAEGRHYFLSDLQLPSQPKSITILYCFDCDTHVYMNFRKHELLDTQNLLFLIV